MTALGRWLKHLLEQPASFWGWVLGGVSVCILGLALVQTLTGKSSTGSEAWTKLMETRDPGDMAEIAKQFPGSPAAEWALLQAGSTFFDRGLADLPNNRDVAKPMLKKALDAYEQVVKSAPNDSPLARIAALGKARTLEASFELPQAIEAYEQVAKNWPDTAEAEEAKQLAEALKKPEAAAFYKDLYSYAPTKVTLPQIDPSTMIPGLPGSSPGGSSPLSGSLPTLPGVTLDPGATMKVPLDLSAPAFKDAPVTLPEAVMKPKAAEAKLAAPADAKPVPAKPAAEAKPAPKTAETKPAASPKP